MTDDERFMQRAIRLAMNGRGRVEPNPMVGCVIVKEGRILGEGYHEQFGGPHAEPNALAACTESPEGATAYVTLEPCCHTNKKTPPCVPRLIAAKLGRVVVGATDPNPQVNGQGIALLRQSGITVDVGVLENECKQLLAPFILQTAEKRPYVTLKWAQTADRRIAGPSGARLQISNARSMRLVHQLRSRCDAILVSVKTIVNDDPILNVRDVPVNRTLTRIVLDSALDIPLDSSVVMTAREYPLVVLASCETYKTSSSKIRQLEEAGVRVEPVNMSTRRFPLEKVLWELGRWGVTHLLVEPGRELGKVFLPMADRVWVFQSPKVLANPLAWRAPKVDFPSTATLNLDGDTLTEYLNPKSPVFFAPVPSADFVLARDSV